MTSQTTLLRSLLLVLFPLATALAQSPVSTRLSSGADIGAGFRPNQVSPSLSYYQLLNITRSRAFSLGWTATFRTFYADNVDYITAPAYLSHGGKSGLYALGTPLVPERLDTLRMASASGTSLNLGIRAQFRIKFLEIGASADILGLTLGRSRVGQYLSSSGYFVAGKTAAGADSTALFRGNNVNQSARPTIANFQLLGDNAIGTLATEVYARVMISQRFGIKAGYQWLTTEYTTTTTNIADGNNRFRGRSGLTYLAVTIPVF